MTRPALKLVSSQSSDALCFRLFMDAWEAWAALFFLPTPLTFMRWQAALQRLEGDRLRTVVAQRRARRA